MKKIILLLFIFQNCYLFSQSKDSISNKNNFITTELLLGKTLESNVNFPERKLHKTLFLNFGKDNTNNPEEWAYRLGYPNTGMSFAITDYGNWKELGYAITAMPYIEFNLNKKRKLKLLFGVGTTYLTKKYDSVPYAFNNYPDVSNRTNSSRLNLSFKMFLYYKFLKTNTSNWYFGAGYFHQSNAHAKLPNKGLNSALISISRQGQLYHKEKLNDKNKIADKHFTKKNYWYVSVRSGAGQHVFSERQNKRKPVYALSVSGGKTYNRTLKIGLGFYYRFYEMYYDFIQSEDPEFLENYSYMTQKPFKYSSNYGVFIMGELLLGNFAMNIDLGYNIYKPFYKVQWKYAEGFYWQLENGETKWVNGELNKKYKLKKQISTRMGLYYYFINTNKNPKNNIFIGAHINANLGQADFSEFSIGFVHNFIK